MNKFLLYRNANLFINNIWIRFAVVYAISVFILILRCYQGIPIITLFNGVIQERGLYSFPIEWFFLVMTPFLIIGGSPRRLFCREYPLVHRVSLNAYIGSIQLLTCSVTTLLVISWAVLDGFAHILYFFTLFIILIALTILFDTFQFFIDSLVVLLIYIALFVVIVSLNYFPFFSSTMYLRWNSMNWISEIIIFFICLVVDIFLNRQVKNINFVG